MSEPDDALNPHATSEIIDVPSPEDALDTAYGAAQWRSALARAFERTGTAEPEPEPEAEP